MAKPTAQQCHALTSHFISGYEERFGSKPVVNRNKARWSMEALLMDYSTKECKELIDFYLKSYKQPSLDWFSMNYEKVIQMQQDHAEREEVSRKRRETTEKRLEEWRDRWKK